MADGLRQPVERGAAPFDQRTLGLRTDVATVPPGLGRLAGQIAIVTGSTLGLGKVISQLFCLEGATVAVVGRDRERGRHAADAAGERAQFFQADLATESGCRQLVESVTADLGPPSILVNNAVKNGPSVHDGAVTDVTWKTWESVLSVNLMAAAMLCRFTLPAMVAAGSGAIVNVSSRAAERGTPRSAAYSASKGGLNALTRSIAMDFSRQGVRCNTVQAGYILHERRDADVSEENLAMRRAQHLTRLARPLDVAQAVLFLAGPESSTITGVTLHVDGGSTSVRGRVLG